MITNRERVGVVFVNYHSEHLVIRRARDLRAAGFTVVVVDNSATYFDDSVSLIRPGSNVGFGAGCNQAVASLTAAVDVVCLHNPDASTTPDAIVKLASMLTVGDGAIAPALRTGGVVRERGFHYPNPTREAYVAARAVRARKGSVAQPVPAEAPTFRGRGRRFGSGALLVVDRRAFVAVGGFDERYFLYAEDLDLWHRLTKAGFRNRFSDDVVVNHVGQAGSAMAQSRRELLRWLGVELFAEVHSPWGWRPYRQIHRALVAGLDDGGEFASRVRAGWRAGNRPSEVLTSVREFLAVDIEAPSPATLM